MAKIIAEFPDTILKKMSVPKLFTALRDKTVTRKHFIRETPTDAYLQGDTIEEYSREVESTRVTVVIFPDREELSMTYKESTVWMVHEFGTNRYRIVFPVSHLFLE